MKMSVYISDESINVVIGDADSKGVVTIKEAKKYMLPPETIINNTITNEDEMRKLLKVVVSENKKYVKNTHLILGGTQILTKTIEVPATSDKNLINIVKKEMSSFNNYTEDMILDYSIVGKGKDGKSVVMLCAAISKDLYDRTVSMFTQEGMKLKRINIAHNAIVSLCNTLPELEKGTFIIMILDGKNLISGLYTDGESKYMSQIRLISRRDTHELMDELTRYMLNIINFAKNTSKDAPQVSRLYVCGVHKAMEAEALARLAESITYPCKLLSDAGYYKLKQGVDFRLSDYIYTTGNLLNR